MKSGSIILTPMPQADGRSKNRPVLVLCRVHPFDDFLVCGISTQLRHTVEGFDEIIAPGDEDFASSRLVEKSLIRLGYLSTIFPPDVKGQLGQIGRERITRLLQRLASFLDQKASAIPAE